MSRISLLLLALSLLSVEPASARGSNVHTFTQNMDVWDGSGGPWLTGHVYIVKAVVTVPTGQTLTVQPGAIVKFDALRYLTVHGTLTAIGTSGAPIRFTSLKDDAVGGDHNGDGSASAPAAGDYRKIDFTPNSTGSTMRWCRVRYGGQNGGPVVDCASSTFSMTDCVVEDGAGAGLDLTVSSGPIERNAFDRCKRAISGMTPGWLHTVRDNTASGNVDGDTLRVDGAGAFGTSIPTRTWAPANSFNGTGEIEMLRAVKVVVNATLTIEAGTKLLFISQADVLQIQGTLITNGTASDPVVLTSVGDPQFGGSGAAPGDWLGVTLSSSPTTTMVHTEVCYAGKSSGAIRLTSSDATITNCTISHSASAGITVGSSYPIVSGCHFDSNATYAISPVPIDVLAGFSGNTATGNGNGDAVALGTATLSSAFSLGPTSAFNGTGAFVLASSMTIAASGSLTLQPGVIVKADPAGNPAVTVQGTLLCNGTPAEPVIFTSFRDDSVGGDLNADGGATTPAPGDWQSIKIFQSGDACVLNHTRIRYAGRSGTRSLYLDGADVTLSDCVFELGDGAGLEAKNSAPTVTGCAFDHCADAPIIELPLESVTGFTGNTAQGNGNGNSIRFAASAVDIALTLKKANTLNGDGVFVFDGVLTVGNAGDLTIDPGVTCKFTADRSLTIHGSLTANGTDLERVAFTSIGDDAFGGDTGGDGPTTGQPGDWRGVALFLAQDVRLFYTHIRYTGAASKAAVETNGGALTMDHVVIEDSVGMGLRSLTLSDLPAVTNTSFDRCLRPVYGVTIAALQGWSGNTAQGNALGDTIRFFTTGSGALSVALSPTESLNGSGVFDSVGYWNVGSNQTVTVAKGVTIKVGHAKPIAVSGTLITNGTASEPVCFTSAYDDGYGGDSNADGGATVPAPGDWVGFAFGSTSDASALNHSVIRYAGLGGAAAIDLDQADITLCNVTIEKCAGAGIDANGNSAPTLKNVSIDDNGGQAVEGVTWGILGKMSGSSATGNQGGDYTYIDSPTIGGDLIIHQESILGTCIVVNVTPNTNTGSLSFGRGVIVKATGSHVEMLVKDVLGTGLEKVVFTSFQDDDHGGDSDQASTPPAPGDWRGVTASGVVEHALVRYAGADIPGVVREAGLRGAGGGCVGTRVEYSAADGFIIGALASGLVAFENAGVGIRSPGVWASTAYGNGEFGFAGGYGPLGDGLTIAYGCIAWMNGPNLTENYQYSADHSAGPPGADVVWSCGTTLGITPPTGFGGVNCGGSGWGNFYADPRFVDAPNGDLRLKADSPCRNYVRVPCPVGILDDPTTCNPWHGSANYPGLAEAARDHLETPRSVDDDQLGPAKKLGDLGAYERPVWTLAPVGEPKLGSVVQLHSVGPAGNAVYLLGFDGPDAYLDPYGWLCFDPSFILTLIALPVGVPFPLAIPDLPLLDGLEVSIQAGIQGASGALEMTNVYRPRFHR